MKERLVVKRSARMFFNAVGIEKIPRALEELSVIHLLMGKSREFRGLLENPRFSGEERSLVMKNIAERLNLSPDTVRFVLYLSEQLVIAHLAECIRVVTNLYLDRKKRAKATVRTPVDTNMKYDGAIKASLKRLTGRDVDIEYVVDPSLLGGVLIQVGSTMYDTSLKGQLRLLRDDLKKG